MMRSHNGVHKSEITFLYFNKQCLIYENVNISIAILPVKKCLYNFVNYLFHHSPEDKVHIIDRVTNLNGYLEIVQSIKYFFSFYVKTFI